MKSRRLKLRGMCLVIGVGWIAASLGTERAQALQHMVEMVSPRGAGRGERVDVLVHGLYLEDAQQIVFHGPGIRCIAIHGLVDIGSDSGLAHGGRIEKGLKATLEIAPDCPLGEHVLRVRTRHFLSEHATFWVGPFPSVSENETRQGANDQALLAQHIPFPSTVNGRILPGEEADKDCFSVHLKKGDRLGVELEAVRLGTLNFGGENDCQIRILAPDGTVLVRCDDTALWLQDPFASIEASVEGAYVVEVSQQMHTPGNYCFYRLHVGGFRRPVAVYPAGGAPGSSLEVTVFEPSPDAASSRCTVLLPDQVRGGELDFFTSFPASAGPVPSGLPLRVTAHPNALEDSAQTHSRGQTVTLPAALNGILARDAETDRWRFRARKGERWVMRMYARALGAPVDARFVVRDAGEGGKVWVDADDATLSARGYWSCHTRLKPKGLLDPAEVFDVPRDGEYVVEVSDTRGMGSPSSVYRLEIEPHRDGLHPYVLGLFAQKISRSIAWVVPRGNRWSLPVMLGEGLGTRFKGDIELEADGLPDGVTMEGGRFSQGLRTTPVTMSATPQAPVGVYPVRLTARASNGHPINGACQQGVTLSDRRGGFAWHSVWLDAFMLAVVEPAPFRVEAAAKRWSVARNGEVTLDLRIDRDPGFSGALELQVDWLPPGVEKGPPVSVGAGQTAVELRLRASEKAMLGEWPLTVTGSTLEGSILDGAGCRLVTTPPLTLKVAEPYLKAAIQRTAIERGHRGTISVEFHENRPLPAPCEARLKRLPFGVAQIGEPVRIAPGQSTCIFEVEVTKDALVGQYKEIALEICIPEEQQIVRQQIGSGVLRVDPEKR
jgi:hypothetical protein